MSRAQEESMRGQLSQNHQDWMSCGLWTHEPIHWQEGRKKGAGSRAQTRRIQRQGQETGSDLKEALRACSNHLRHSWKELVRVPQCLSFLFWIVITFWGKQMAVWLVWTSSLPWHHWWHDSGHGMWANILYSNSVSYFYGIYPSFSSSLSARNTELMAGDKQDCLWQILDIIYFTNKHFNYLDIFKKILITIPISHMEKIIPFLLSNMQWLFSPSCVCNFFFQIYSVHCK